ncbi:butyrophilin-like protein 1 [Trichechus manatus latirostris]|uniref:Butyrophilin-like protein 1 n=1 Tax=Trichechus manatus latirostris TaxID=127582 RepID=A0A2Y9QDQ5_TRIMA|nr:butyrophilin-like protein 1 [Trichechus manatus latirostris]
MLVLVILGAGYFLKKEHSAKVQVLKARALNLLELLSLEMLQEVTDFQSWNQEKQLSYSHVLSTDRFLVFGPTDPIVAVLGRDTMLSCTLSPAMSAENMELRWYRSKFSEAVFIYQNQREQKEGQMPEYSGRTSLVKDFLTWGEAAVRIDKVRISDNGQYTCLFGKGRFYERATLEIKVAGVGSAPEMRIEGPEEDGVRVACTASGWFPKPQVQWRDLSGEKFLAFSEAHAQDSDGLYRVESSLVVRDSSAGNVTCSILNPILGQEKAKAIFIPDWRKAVYQAAWRKAQLYADWRKEQFQSCE